MGKITSLVLALCLFSITCTEAQKLMISLNGSYGLISPDGDIFRHFQPVGASLSAEVSVGGKWTYGLDVDGQFVGSYPAIAIPASPNPFGEELYGPLYTISLYQYNIRPTVRYYFRESLKGLYIGAFAAYGYLTTKARNYPDDPYYTQKALNAQADGFGLGGGLTYGYRLKLARSLQGSLFVTHQFLRMQNSEILRDQYNNQVGLGLNWMF